jgi:hypothetical protein
MRCTDQRNPEASKLTLVREALAMDMQGFVGSSRQGCMACRAG